MNEATIKDYRARLVDAAALLVEERDSRSEMTNERSRLNGKMQGVLLAIFVAFVIFTPLMRSCVKCRWHSVN